MKNLKYVKCEFISDKTGRKVGTISNIEETLANSLLKSNTVRFLEEEKPEPIEQKPAQEEKVDKSIESSEENKMVEKSPKNKMVGSSPKNKSIGKSKKSKK